jgi:hypothetical protein
MSKRVWQVTHENGVLEEVVAASLSISAHDTAHFFDGGWILSLSREEYRSIRFVRDLPEPSSVSEPKPAEPEATP